MKQLVYIVFGFIVLYSILGSLCDGKEFLSASRYTSLWTNFKVTLKYNHLKLHFPQNKILTLLLRDKGSNKSNFGGLDFYKHGEINGKVSLGKEGTQ
jgi:hypothetical protein